jgi:hypothetical protein
MLTNALAQRVHVNVMDFRSNYSRNFIEENAEVEKSVGIFHSKRDIHLGLGYSFNTNKVRHLVMYEFFHSEIYKTIELKKDTNSDYRRNSVYRFSHGLRYIATKELKLYKQLYFNYGLSAAIIYHPIYELDKTTYIKMDEEMANDAEFTYLTGYGVDLGVYLGLDYKFSRFIMGFQVNPNMNFEQFNSVTNYLEFNFDDPFDIVEGEKKQMSSFNLDYIGFAIHFQYVLK